MTSCPRTYFHLPYLSTWSPCRWAWAIVRAPHPRRSCRAEIGSNSSARMPVAAGGFRCGPASLWRLVLALTGGLPKMMSIGTMGGYVSVTHCRQPPRLAMRWEYVICGTISLVALRVGLKAWGSQQSLEEHNRFRAGTSPTASTVKKPHSMGNGDSIDESAQDYVGRVHFGVLLELQSRPVLRWTPTRH